VNAYFIDNLLLDAPTHKSLAIEPTAQGLQRKDGWTRFSGTSTGSEQALNRLIHMFFEESALR
jgi:hypothetical protein